MEFAKFQHEFTQRYIADGHGTLAELDQQPCVYVISQNSKPPYKIGYVKYHIMPRMHTFRTDFRKFYVHTNWYADRVQ